MEKHSKGLEPVLLCTDKPPPMVDLATSDFIESAFIDWNATDNSAVHYTIHLSQNNHVHDLTSNELARQCVSTVTAKSNKLVSSVCIDGNIQER